jgi:hypothetical protein
MPSKPKSSNKPEVRMTKVPAISQLTEHLGFQHASRIETENFLGAVHAWRKSYITDGGLPGKELLQWNKPEVQIELGLMAERFVDNNGVGERFWSIERDWFQASDLEYPDDKKE